MVREREDREEAWVGQLGRSGEQRCQTWLEMVTDPGLEPGVEESKKASGR